MKRKNLLIFIVTSLIFILLYFLPIHSKDMIKAGIKPYELPESEARIMKHLGMDQKFRIMSFRPPREANTINLTLYKLTGENTWEILNNIQVEKIEKLSVGEFSILQKDKSSIQLSLITNNDVIHTAPSGGVEDEFTIWRTSYLEEFKSIGLDEELPVAIMVYNDKNEMKTYQLEDFFESERLADYTLVQAVTITFSNR